MKNLKERVIEKINAELDVYQLPPKGVVEIGERTLKVRVPFFNRLLEPVVLYITEGEDGNYYIADNDEIVGNRVSATVDSEEAALFIISRLVRIVEHDFNSNITSENLDSNLEEAQNAFNKVCAKLMALGFESDSFNQ